MAPPLLNPAVFSAVMIMVLQRLPPAARALHIGKDATSGLPGFMSFTSREQIVVWETDTVKRLAWVETTQGVSNIFAADDVSGKLMPM